MSKFDTLVARIRGEYQEMPGLRLTMAQACRLWQIDRDLCDQALQRLVGEGFLEHTADEDALAVPSAGQHRYSAQTGFFERHSVRHGRRTFGT